MAKTGIKINFQPKIVEEIVRQKPEQLSPVDYLMRLFSISKETAYRRLRNEIPFSIDEAYAIADNLNLSVDQMLGLESGNNHLFIKGFNFKQDSVDIYSDLLRNDIENAKKIIAAKDDKIVAIMNRVPFRFLPYKALFKLEYCHNLYSVGKISMMTRYSDIEVPPIISMLQQKTASLFVRLNNVTCVIDSTVYSDIIQKIKYYHRSKFISDEELKTLQDELFDLLEMYENILRNGKNSAGSNYTFYYSLFNFESSIIFCEYDNNSLLQIWIYPESPIVIKNNYLINDVQKQWIVSKIRNSVLITKTADIQQIDMLRDLHRQIKCLSNNYELLM